MATSIKKVETSTLEAVDDLTSDDFIPVSKKVGSTYTLKKIRAPDLRDALTLDSVPLSQVLHSTDVDISALPNAATRANKIVSFDATGNVPTMIAVPSSIGAWIPYPATTYTFPAGNVVTTVAGEVPIGAATTNPGKGVVAFEKAKYRMVGENIEIDMRYQISGGTAGSGIYYFPMPPGIFIDNNDFSTTGTLNEIGRGTYFDGTTAYSLTIGYNPAVANLIFALIYLHTFTPTAFNYVGSTYANLSVAQYTGIRASIKVM